MRATASPRTGISIVVFAAILLMIPAAASAKQGFDLALQLPVGHGYKISVGGYGATAFMKASKGVGPARREWSTYIARGKVTPTTIRASFGDIGSATMRFRPSGRVTHSKRHRGCLGAADRYTIRFGVFVGSVRFRGEGGYASAQAHRVKGRVVTPRQLICADTLFSPSQPQGGGNATKAGKQTLLTAESRAGLTATSFAAREKGGRAAFLALSEQSVGSLAILRGALVRTSPLAFAFSGGLSFASVTPPAPFSGTGSLQRGPDGSRIWSGSLAVSLPGAPDVPLTGAGFKTRLTRSW